MTQEQQDTAWRSLPKDFKRQLRCDYTTAESAHSLDPTNVRMEAHKKILEMYFGKQNLTMTEEEKPRFKVGDVVITTKDTSMYSMGWIGEIEQIDTNFAAVRLFVKDEITVKVDTNHLAPYTKEQEPKKGERVDFSSSSLQNRKNLTENDISSVPKETAEDLSNLMAEVNNFIERNQDSQVDWLTYRMELAKEVAVALIRKGHNIAFVAESASLIVDGIIERLKGGMSQ